MKAKKINIVFILSLVNDFLKLSLQAYFFTLFLINNLKVFKEKCPNTLKLSLDILGDRISWY